MGKRCTTCGEIKSLKEFNKSRAKKDGLQHKCRSCEKEYRQSEKGKQVQKKYWGSEKGKRTSKKYKISEKGRRTQRKFNVSSKGRALSKRYKSTIKGRLTRKRLKAIRRTNEAKSGGYHTNDEWYSLCKFYDFECLKCNKKFAFEELEFDHIKPVSKGGSSFIWNAQPLCSKCNNIKGAKEIDYRNTLPGWINRGGPVWQQDRLL